MTPAAKVEHVLDVEPTSPVLAQFHAAQARRNAAAAKAIRLYYDNPTAFALNCIEWEDDERPTDYQLDILASIPKHRRVGVRSLHGAGKTTTNSLAVLWFAITRDAAEVDWKAPTTAGAWRQLDKYLWPEIHKWSKRVRWDMIGRPPFRKGHELLKLNLNLRNGSAFAVASDDPSLIEGVHADSVLYIFDESKSIIPATFDAAEGAFSGEGAAQEAFALATSTPGEPSGRFYEICTHAPGLDDWHTIHVGLSTAIASGRVSQAWADQRKLQWGEQSATYANRVLGEFHSSDDDGVIPLSWIEAANERWEATTLEIEKGRFVLDKLDVVGVDVARSGDDKTCIALKHGDRIHELRYTFHEDTMQTTGRVGGILTLHRQAKAIVDTDGLGAGVTDRLREQGYNVDAFHAGASVDKYTTDASGELSFVNVRAAAWWRMRQLLDPANDPKLELPPDDRLTGDLTSPHWVVASNSKIKVESKDDIKKRLGRSTDAADAVIQACWEPRKRRKARMTFVGAAT